MIRRNGCGPPDKLVSDFEPATGKSGLFGCGATEDDRPGAVGGSATGCGRGSLLCLRPSAMFAGIEVAARKI